MPFTVTVGVVGFVVPVFYVLIFTVCVPSVFCIEIVLPFSVMLFDVVFILTNSTDGVVVLLTMYEPLNSVFTFCVVMLISEDVDMDTFVKLLIYSFELLSNTRVLFDVVSLLIVSVFNLLIFILTVFVETVVFTNVLPPLVINIVGVSSLSVALV